MIRRPPRSTLSSSSAASDVYKRQLVWLMEAFDSSIFPRQRASSRSRHHPKVRPNHGSGSDLDGSETHRGFGVSASDELHAGPLGFVNCVDSSAVLRGMMEP